MENHSNKHNRNKNDNKSNTINSYNSILAKYNENKIPVLIQGFLRKQNSDPRRSGAF